MRMLSSSANCARMPPADLLVDPEASASRSRSTTSRTPSRRRWKAAAAPRAPPPMTTTSAVLADAVEELAERFPVPGRAAAPLDHAELLERERVLDAGLDHEAGGQERIGLRVHVVQRPHEA